MFGLSMLLLKGWLLIAFLSIFSLLASAEFTSIALTGKLEGCTLEYQLNLNDPNLFNQDTITIRYTVPRSSWIAVGVSPDGTMINSEVVIGKPVERTIRKHKLTGRSVDAIIEMPRYTLFNATFSRTNSVTTLQYTKLLVEDGEISINPNGPNTFVAAFGFNSTFGFHQGYGSFVVDLSTDGISPSPPVVTPTSAPAPTTPAEPGFRLVPLGDALADTSFQYRLNRNDVNAGGADTISIRFTCPGSSWVGVAVARDFGRMIPAKSVIGYPNSGVAPLRYLMQMRDVSGVNPLPDAEQNLIDPQVVIANGKTTLSYTIPVSTTTSAINAPNEALEIYPDGRLTNFNIACGSNTIPSFHRLMGSFNVLLEDGTGPAPAPMLPPTNAPVPSPTGSPIMMTPTIVPAPTPTTSGFRQVFFTGGALTDPFEYRLNPYDPKANGASTITIRFTCPGNVWVGVAVPLEVGKMVPAKSVIGFPGEGNSPPRRYLMEDHNVTAVNPLADEDQNLIDPQVVFANGKTTLSYTIPVYTAGMPDEDLEVHADGRIQSFNIACGWNAGPSFHRITGTISTAILEGTSRPTPPPTSPAIVIPTASPVMIPTTNSPAMSPTNSPVSLPTTASPNVPVPTNAPVMTPTTMSPVMSPTNVPVTGPTTNYPTTGTSLPTNTPVSMPTTASPMATPTTEIPVPTAEPTFLDPTSSFAASGIGRVSLSGFALLIMMTIATQNILG